MPPMPPQEGFDGKPPALAGPIFVVGDQTNLAPPAAVPHHRPLSRYLPGHIRQELDYFFARPMAIDQQPEVQTHPHGLGTEGHTTDHRDTIVLGGATPDHTLT